MRFARRRRTFFAVVIPLVLWLFGRPEWRSFWPGLCCVVLGQALRVWASGYIHKEQEVAASGPYAYMRNPLYLGSFVISVGFALMANTWWAWPTIAFQFAFFYYLTILSEERYLAARLGRAYEEYRSAVPRLVPRLTPHRGVQGQFQWDQVMYNEEYRSIIPVGLLCCLFAARLLWRI